MEQRSTDTKHHMLLCGAALWLLMALILAWCLIGLNFGVTPLKAVFAGKFTRLLQAHIDFLLMTALILGIAATRVRLPGTVRWAMVIGAFTNSSLFLLMAIFPSLDNPQMPPHVTQGSPVCQPDYDLLWVWQSFGIDSQICAPALGQHFAGHGRGNRAVSAKRDRVQSITALVGGNDHSHSTPATWH